MGLCERLFLKALIFFGAGAKEIDPLSDGESTSGVPLGLEMS
jgi:hypothetical protein